MVMTMQTSLDYFQAYGYNPDAVSSVANPHFLDSSTAIAVLPWMGRNFGKGSRYVEIKDTFGGRSGKYGTGGSTTHEHSSNIVSKDVGGGGSTNGGGAGRDSLVTRAFRKASDAIKSWFRSVDKSDFVASDGTPAGLIDEPFDLKPILDQTIQGKLVTDALWDRLLNMKDESGLTDYIIKQWVDKLDDPGTAPRLSDGRDIYLPETAYSDIKGYLD